MSCVNKSHVECKKSKDTCVYSEGSCQQRQRAFHTRKRSCGTKSASECKDAKEKCVYYSTSDPKCQKRKNKVHTRTHITKPHTTKPHTTKPHTKPRLTQRAHAYMDVERESTKIERPRPKSTRRAFMEVTSETSKIVPPPVKQYFASHRQQHIPQTAFEDLIDVSRNITPTRKTFETLKQFVSKDPEAYLKFCGTYMYAWGWLLYLQKLFADTICIAEFSNPQGEFGERQRGYQYHKQTKMFEVKRWALESTFECLKKKRFVVAILSHTSYGTPFHANALVFDGKSQSLTRFEPNGGDAFPESNKAIKKWMIGSFPGWKYHAPPDFCPTLGPQRIEAKAPTLPGEIHGYCQAWSLMFLHLRLLNPDIPNGQIVQQMTATKNAEHLREMIRNYAGFVAEQTQRTLAKSLLDAGSYVQITDPQYTKLIPNIYGKIIDVVFNPVLFERQPQLFVMNWPTQSGGHTSTLIPWHIGKPIPFLEPVTDPILTNSIEAALMKWKLSGLKN